MTFISSFSQTFNTFSLISFLPDILTFFFTDKTETIIRELYKLLLPLPPTHLHLCLILLLWMNSLCSRLRLALPLVLWPRLLSPTVFQPLSPFSLLFHHLCTFLYISLQIDYNFSHLKNDSAFVHYTPCLHRGWLSGGTSGKEPACQCKRLKFNPWVRKIPWKSSWQPTAPGESHGQRSLEGPSL